MSSQEEFIVKSELLFEIPKIPVAKILKQSIDQIVANHPERIALVSFLNIFFLLLIQLNVIPKLLFVLVTLSKIHCVFMTN